MKLLRASQGKAGPARNGARNGDRPGDRKGDRIEAEIDLGDRIAPVTARVNRRARRLIVKVDPVQGRVLVTAPSRRALAEAMRFAADRAGWIRDRLDEGTPARPFAAGGVCPLRGADRLIVNEGGARAPVRLLDGAPPRLLVGGDPAHLNRRLCDWLKREALADLAARADAHCARLGRERKAIRIRDTRSRWGSCSSDGVLSFSWRLILAPPWVLDYVAAHECAHLAHLDHSRAYWRTLAGLDVDIDGARAWFDAHGQALHAWGAEPRPRRAAA